MLRLIACKEAAIVRLKWNNGKHKGLEKLLRPKTTPAHDTQDPAISGALVYIYTGAHKSGGPFWTHTAANVRGNIPEQEVKSSSYSLQNCRTGTYSSVVNSFLATALSVTASLQLCNCNCNCTVIYVFR